MWLSISFIKQYSITKVTENHVPVIITIQILEKKNQCCFSFMEENLRNVCGTNRNFVLKFLLFYN